MCVQNFDDSRNPAIRITYRISLRSSSLWEPRHPLLKVVKMLEWKTRTEGNSVLIPFVSEFVYYDFLVSTSNKSNRWPRNGKDFVKNWKYIN